ncbi:hypothetical protein LV75_000851 [Actinokineospora diospyrosa]|uniref:Uncharacterized protein n=1 Tax=Actinokineospora diospyrosa TaxID=103728 RepID=A0ABT1I6W2_9PSEU|nr:hypothetical protein [Actinokineospora diospyrosa]
MAPQGPSVQALGWQGSRERAEMAPAVPTVHALALWVAAGPDGSRDGTVGSEGWRVVVHNVFCCPQALVADLDLSGSVNRLYIGGSCGR